jgi:hypothetical protein
VFHFFSVDDWDLVATSDGPSSIDRFDMELAMRKIEDDIRRQKEEDQIRRISLRNRVEYFD